MMKIHFFVFVFVLAILNQIHTSDALTKTQLKKAAKLMRNVCQPKHNVTNAQVDNISTGEFIEDKNVMCYIACVLTMAQTIKNGKVSYESALKQVEMIFPENLKERGRKALATCRYVADEYPKDLCRASFEVSKCMQKTDQEVFMFP